jgi:hypothetical protein
MATNNATDTSNPVSISQGGTNASSMTNADGVVYYNGTLLSTTGVGTSGQVLTSNGAGVAPSFQAGGGGTGGLVLLASQTASSSSSIDFTSVISGTYDAYELYFSAVVPTTNTDFLEMLISINNGSTWLTANGSYAAGVNYAAQGSGTFSNFNDALGRFIPLSSALSNTSGTGASGRLTFYNTGNGGTFAMTGLCVFNGSTSGAGTLGWFGDGNGSIGVNAIRFLMSTGTIASGTFSLYGIAE